MAVIAVLMMRKDVGVMGWMSMAAGGGVCVRSREAAVEPDFESYKVFLEAPKVG